MDNEKIDLDNATQVPINELSKTISATAPRFTFYIYQHGSSESLGKTENVYISEIIAHMHMISFHIYMSLKLQDQRAHVVLIF